MKILVIFGACVLVLAGCPSTEYQKMQAERDQLLKNYEGLREENSELKLKNTMLELLVFLAAVPMDKKQHLMYPNKQQRFRKK